MAERPLPERLAEIADLPSIGIALTLERRTAIAEAVELARRVEAAPVATLDAAGLAFPIELRDADPRIIRLNGKRVALVEVPGE